MKTYVWALYASLLLYSCGANNTNRQDGKEDASTEQTQKAKKEQVGDAGCHQGLS
mgnify:CR=1 FL=1